MYVKILYNKKMRKMAFGYNCVRVTANVQKRPFQGGTSFVDLLCMLTSWLSFVVSTVSLSLSHWYPGSGVVLDCIDS